MPLTKSPSQLGERSILVLRIEMMQKPGNVLFSLSKSTYVRLLRKIKRKRKDKYTYTYQDKQGRPVDPKIVEVCLQGLYIPPAHDNVKINLHKSSKVLAIGYDSKGRPQYFLTSSYPAL